LSSFVTDHPVAGPGRYFGREQLLRSLMTGLMTGRSFLLCGGPKVGRSSTLAQLVHQHEVSLRRDPGAQPVLLVPLDLTPLATTGWQRFVTGLYETIRKAVVDPRRFGRTKPIRPPELVLTRKDDPWEKLGATLEELWRSLEGTPAWCRYALLVDQGDLLLSPELETELEPFAMFIRTDAAWAPRAVVLAVGRSFREQLLESSSPFAFARPVFLGVLRESEATALISAPFEAAEEPFVSDLIADSGKHPYLLQLLCAEYEHQKFDTASEQVVAAVRPAMTELFERVWQELDLGRGVTYRGAYAAPEHALMQYLIERPEPTDLKTAESDLGIKPLKEFAELLEYCGVIERVITGNVNSFRAPGRLWNAWYLARVSE
jgi:hypothetical protein